MAQSDLWVAYLDPLMAWLISIPFNNLRFRINSAKLTNKIKNFTRTRWTYKRTMRNFITQWRVMIKYKWWLVQIYHQVTLIISSHSYNKSIKRILISLKIPHKNINNLLLIIMLKKALLSSRKKLIVLILITIILMKIKKYWKILKIKIILATDKKV